jgi:hypothetical protein
MFSDAVATSLIRTQRSSYSVEIMAGASEAVGWIRETVVFPHVRERTRHKQCSCTRYSFCRDVGSLACLLLRNATIVCNRRGWYVDTSA